MHLFGNNQHAEGVIKYLKEQPDLKIHTKQPATYFWWWFNNSIKAMRKLVYEYETAACILKRRQMYSIMKPSIKIRYGGMTKGTMEGMANSDY